MILTVHIVAFYSYLVFSVDDQRSRYYVIGLFPADDGLVFHGLLIFARVIALFMSLVTFYSYLVS